jgi:hypothetical protein
MYPHALREANAYYSPQKKAILFGYFNAIPYRPNLHMPNGTVFTCLNHDIIAHEVTHALLDGMHRRYVEATHLDSLAFHEAFADIVALFQHFTFPNVLKQQIAKTRGNLASQNLLGQLAQEFGKATGHHGSLRDAIGKMKGDKWEPRVPDPLEYHLKREPHDRGAILVATIFDAFLSIYKYRIADMLRLASGGTGILEGELHPDLVNRLANEAAKTAGHLMRMCIRALDYCPPMDINFGDYLRAIITADFDLVDEDPYGYKIAIIEAFQKRGIYPENIKNMSVDSLLCIPEMTIDFNKNFSGLIDIFKMFKEKISYITDREEIHFLTQLFQRGGTYKEYRDEFDKKISPYDPKNIPGLHGRIMKIVLEDPGAAEELEKLTGLVFSKNPEDIRGFDLSGRYTEYPKFEVHNFKLANRVGPKGKVINQIVLTITQRRGIIMEKNPDTGKVFVKGYFSPGNPKSGWSHYENGVRKDEENPMIKKATKDSGMDAILPENWFVFRGGTTLIFDLGNFNGEDIRLRYAVTKDIRDEKRMARQHAILYDQEDTSLNATYFGKPQGNLEAEPFAIIHKIL